MADDITSPIRKSCLTAETIVELENVEDIQGVELFAVNDPCVEMCLKFARRDSKSTPCYRMRKLPKRSLIHS